MSGESRKADWGDDDTGEIGNGRNSTKPTMNWSAEPHGTSLNGEQWRLSHLMILVVIAAVFFWLWVVLGGAFLVFNLVMLFAIAIGIGVILGRRRSTRQDSLLGVIAIAAERGMPLAPAVAAFADQYGGRYRRRVMKLADELNWGCTLPEALARVPRLVSMDAMLLARVGQNCGRLPQALRLASTSRSSQLPLWTAIASRLAYLLAMLLAIQLIGGFILYFIVPKFEAIFKDFGVPLPPITILVIDASHFIVKYGLITGFAPLLEILLLALLPFSFAGWVNYNVPFFDRLLRRRHTTLILRTLALVVEAEKPIELGLATLANHYPAWWIRRKLIRVEAEVRHGAEWADALRRQGVIRDADYDVLHSARAVGNLDWAMHELAESAERRLVIRFQAWLQVLFPLVVIGAGAVIFLMVVGFFSPLVELIGRLSG